MKQYAIAGGLIAFCAWSWWIYGLGQDSIEAKIDKTTTTETIRQANDAGNLKAGDAKHATKIIERIKIVRAAPSPLDCAAVDIGDDRVLVLGGMFNSDGDDAIKP